MIHNASRQRTVLALLLSAALLVLLGSSMVGSVSIPLSGLPAALAGLFGSGEGGIAATLLDLRLGRACAAFVTGAALALAGVMMQALLRNPLADPYVLGISSGAAVGALA